MLAAGPAPGVEANGEGEPGRSILRAAEDTLPLRAEDELAEVLEGPEAI